MIARESGAACPEGALEHHQIARPEVRPRAAGAGKVIVRVAESMHDQAGAFDVADDRSKKKRAARGTEAATEEVEESIREKPARGRVPARHGVPIEIAEELQVRPARLDLPDAHTRAARLGYAAAVAPVHPSPNVGLGLFQVDVDHVLLVPRTQPVADQGELVRREER